MEENYHLLVESIKDYAIYMLDPSGHVTTWNIGAERFKGYTEAEIRGKHFSVFFTSDDQHSGKPDKELQAALSKGRYEEEGWRIRKDGTKFWANIILNPIYSHSNEHLGFAKITRDLTEKRKNDELYLLLVSQVKEYGLFMMDNSGHILTWNEGAERIKGYTAPEILGTHFSIFYTPEDKAVDKPEKELQIAVAMGKYEEEGWRVRKNGTRFWANVVITPIYKDSHIGFAKVTRDLTEQKELEKLTRANMILEATNKELERFAFIASHDLKEPLRKIAMYSDRALTENTTPNSEKRRGYLNKIVESCKRMNLLIDDVLELALLSEKQHFEKVSLNLVLRDTLELLEQNIEEKKAIIQSNDLPDAIIISSQMRQLFQNLVSNALKFSKKDVQPLIVLNHTIVKKDHINADELWPSDEYLMLTFKDNGIGFDQEHAEKIFNIFDRLHNKNTYAGTGIGLAICKKIVENHGGMIMAESRIGEGAEFTIVIPA